MEDFNLMYTFVPHLENHGETEEIDCKFSSLTVNLPVSTSTGEAAQELNNAFEIEKNTIFRLLSFQTREVRFKNVSEME